MHAIRYANNSEGIRVSPTISGDRATCPTCKSLVVAKCGEINRWHWSHLSACECDTWAEPLTAWHIAWQEYLESYKNAETEVPIKKTGITHRADAVLPDGRIIELQHSAITPRDIYLREDFYGSKLVWIFDLHDAYEKKRFDLRKKNGKDTFRWKQPKKSIAFAENKVYLDLGKGYIFELSKMFPDSPCGGFGKLHYSGRLMRNILI